MYLYLSEYNNSLTNKNMSKRKLKMNINCPFIFCVGLGFQWKRPIWDFANCFSFLLWNLIHLPPKKISKRDSFIIFFSDFCYIKIVLRFHKIQWISQHCSTVVTGGTMVQPPSPHPQPVDFSIKNNFPLNFSMHV